LTHLGCFGAPGYAGGGGRAHLWRISSQLGRRCQVDLLGLGFDPGLVGHNKLHVKFYIWVKIIYLQLMHHFLCVRGVENGWIELDEIGRHSRFGVRPSQLGRWFSNRLARALDCCCARCAHFFIVIYIHICSYSVFKHERSLFAPGGLHWLPWMTFPYELSITAAAFSLTIEVFILI
jgi:hypothetical protein